MNKKQIELMRKAANEISFLRSENHIQRVRLNMFDDMMSLFKANGQGYGMSATNMDTVRDLQEAADEAEKANQ